MNFRLIRWRLPLSYAAIALLTALSLGVILILILLSFYQREERSYLQGNAQAISAAVARTLETDLPEHVLRGQLNDLSFLLQVRIRLLDNQGDTLVDTGIPGLQHSATNADPSSRGESSPLEVVVTQEAQVIQEQDGTETIMIESTMPMLYRSLYGFDLAQGDGEQIRRSGETVSQPVTGSQDNQLGVLVLSEGPAFGTEIVTSVALAWALAGVVAVLLAAIVGWLASQRMVRPLSALADVTQQMAAGDLSARARADAPDELGALGGSFNLMAQRIETMVTALRNFIGDAAHGLNTPLTALRTNLEILGEEGNPDRSTQTLERAQTEVVRLEVLSRALLDLSRLESHAADKTYKSVDMTRLLYDLSEVYASQAEQAEIHFDADLPEESVNILADEGQIRQAVGNLLDNALKFTPVGGEVHLSAEIEDQMVKITVTDSGIGIPDEDIPHLFNRFHRGRNTAAFPGSGLGLAIVKAIAENHSGTVYSRNTEKGAKFTMSLPLME